MPISVTVTVLEQLEKRIEIPDACPECKADLMAEGAIRFTRAVDERGGASRDGDSIEPDDDTAEDGDGSIYGVQDYYCASCARSFGGAVE